MASEEKSVESKGAGGQAAMLEAAVFVIEKAESIPEGLRDRLRKVLDASETVEMGDPFLETLQSRFTVHFRRHMGIEWAQVEKALLVHPEKLVSLRKMEEAGGEPDVLGSFGDSFVFCDFSKSIPGNRSKVSFFEAEEKVRELGAELMDKVQFLRFKEVFELNSRNFIWLKTPEGILKKGYALVGDRQFDAPKVKRHIAHKHFERSAWRAVLKVLRA